MAFFDGDGEVRTVYLAKKAPDAVVGMFDNGCATFVATYDILRAEGTADAAGLAPVAKDNLIV
jgi:hypothetical protein